MRTTTAAWNTAIARAKTVGSLSGSGSPIFLVDGWGFGRVFSTRTFAPGGPWLAGDGLLAGADILAGAQHTTTEREVAALRNNGIGTISVDLDDQGNILRISQGSVALLNHGGLADGLVSLILDNKAVRLRLGFVGLAWQDYLTIFPGIIDRHLITPEEIRFDLIDSTLRHHRNLNTPIDIQYFPGAPLGNREKHIPILLGINVDAPTIQVSGTAVGSLAFGIASTALALDIREYGAPFPASGTISIASETGVTYASRRLVTLLGTTYLRLEGLVRGAPVSHPIKAAVTLTSIKYVYLIGYQIATLNEVRENGVILASGYTLSTGTADFPVSLLTFTTQRNTITVHVNAANLDDTNYVVNGGFETGNNTGWTAGSGAAVAFGQTTPDPEEGAGLWYLELTGGLNTYAEDYQDIPAVVGEDYNIDVHYRNEDAGSDLLTNGGFESGNLSGWTVNAANSSNYTTLVGTQFDGPVAEGLYALLVSATDPSLGSYTFEMYQDVTTVASSQYLLSVRHYTQSFLFFVEGSSDVPVGLVGRQQDSRVSVLIGTADDPGIYVNSGPLFPTVIQQGGGTSGAAGASHTNDAYDQGRSMAFTPTTTATRITLRITGTSTVGARIWVPPFASLDGLRVRLATVVDTSYAGVRLGTPTLPEAYEVKDLSLAYVWKRFSTKITAADPLLRLALRSKYSVSGLPHPSYFDTVSVTRANLFNRGSGGENPVDAIRYIIQTFLPNAPINQGSFSTAYTKLLAWKFGTYLTAPGDSRTLLQRMAYQCNSLLLESPEGALKLIVRDNSRSVVWGFNQSNISPNTLRQEPEPIDNIYTNITIYFGSQTGGSTNPADFQGKTYATPTETTHPTDTALVALCIAASVLTGRPRPLVVFADFIQDFATANLLLTEIVRRVTIRHDILTLSTWPDACVLEMLDVVQVHHPRLYQNAPVQAEVIGTRFDPATMQVHLRLQTYGQTGWADEANYDPLLIELPGFIDDAEYTPTLLDGLGFADECEPSMAELLRQARARRLVRRQRRRFLPRRPRGPRPLL